MTHSPLATPGATIDVLRSHELFARKSLGQHFLIDDNAIGRILALAALDASVPVLEVGPGIGTLTLALCEHAGWVMAVERDGRLIDVLRETTAEYENLTILHKDALDLTAEDVLTPIGPPHALVANLPYSVAATLVLKFFEEFESLRVAVVMVQAEVADRMAAPPGGKDYGGYSVKLGLLARVTGRFSVSRACFLPPPRVDSAVVRLERVSRSETPDTLAAARRCADAAFSHRRKTLRNSLRAALHTRTDVLDAALETAGIDGGRRAETLSIGEFVTLATALAKGGLLGE